MNHSKTGLSILILSLASVCVACDRDWGYRGQGFYRGTLIVTVKTGRFGLSGARVEVTKTDTGEMWTGKTNDRGIFYKAGLMSGIYDIVVTARGYSPQRDTVHVTPSLSESESRIEMVQIGESVLGLIEGKVTDKKRSAPIGKAQISIVQLNTGREYQTESNHEGYYEKAALLPGKYRLKVEAPDYRPMGKKVELEERGVVKGDFRLKHR